MSDQRLSRDAFAEAITLIVDHWPSTRKWANAPAVYPTLSYYSDDVILSAVRSIIATTPEHPPGPVDVLREVKRVVKARQEARRAVDRDHPAGHVWGIDPDVITGDPALRRAWCALCGVQRVGTPETLRTSLEHAAATTLEESP